MAICSACGQDIGMNVANCPRCGNPASTASMVYGRTIAISVGVFSVVVIVAWFALSGG